MPSIASSVVGSAHAAGSTSTSQHSPVRYGADGAPVGGRSRAPEATPSAGRESDSGRPDANRVTGLEPAAAGGLVICAENVRSPSSDWIAFGDLRAIDALGLRFPSPEMVAAAAAQFSPAEPWASGRGRRGTEPESGRFRITVGPGVVRLRHCHHQVVPEIEVSDVSDLAELDYSPLVESGRVPAMVTLTYPGDWEAVAPDGASVKRHMVLWRKRFQREYGESVRYIWKLEFQRRGAPHVHLWMAPPMSPGRSGRTCAQWLSETWAQVVDHPDPEQRARHRLAGTAIDVRNGLKACDPKRLAIYFTKHSSPNMNGDKEYQHIVPELWRQPGRGPGRFWGVYGLKKSIAVVEVAQDAYVAARRIVRRWSRSQAVYGDSGNRFPTAVVPRTAAPMVPRVNRDSGRVTYRRVRRRRTLCNQGGFSGG